MDTPLSLLVKGESGSGKSYTSMKVMELIPPEGVKFMIRATAQAFFHLPEDGLEHKIVFINEQPGSEASDYAIRSAQSEKNLSLLMPIKNPVTGDMETVEKIVRGPAGFLVTTTMANIHHENETRNFSIFSDDTPEQTERIRELVTVRDALGQAFGITDDEIRLWQNIQRILHLRMQEKKFKVRIPFAQEVLDSFPNNPVRVRRDMNKFITLIRVITILHQFHREVVEEDGENWLIATVADYHLARIIGEETITSSLYNFPKQSDELLMTIQRNYSDGKEFTIKDIESVIRWPEHKVRRFLKYIHTAEFVECVDVIKKTNAKVYKLVPESSSPGKFMINPSALINAYPCNSKLFYNPLNYLGN